MRESLLYTAKAMCIIIITKLFDFLFYNSRFPERADLQVGYVDENKSM